MIRRQWIISAIISFLILIVGGFVSQKFKAKKTSTVSEEPVKQELIVVESAQFQKEDLPSSINIDGRINAVEKIDIAAEVTGRLIPIERTWRQGSYFKKGELLFKVDSEDERYNLFAQRSNLLNAITQIMPDLKFDFPEAFDSWKYYLDDFDPEKTTPPLPDVTTEQEKYYVAGKNIYNLYYSIKSAEDRLKNFRVYAPFNGVFLSINAFPGSLVSPGASLGRLMNISKYEMETPINMKDFNLVKRGQGVKLYSTDLNKTFKGTISRISNTIDQTTQSIPIYISVTGKGLRDGMYLEGKLKGGTINNVAAIPREAIVGQNSLYILVDSVIHQKEIEIVLRSDENVFVRGIEPEENVIIKGLNSLSPGQKAINSNQE